MDEIPTPGTFQADMMFVPEQWAELFNIQFTKSNRDVTYDVGLSARIKKRTAFVSYHEHYWPLGIIPVRFSLDNSEDINAAISAMGHYSENTCLQFVYYTKEVGEALGHNTYLDFVSGLQGCWSFVGRVVPTNQTLSVGEGCGQVGTLVHEIGHAIGLHHEQSRPDRDFFVEIEFEHIRAEDMVNFYRYPTGVIETANIPYDEASIMHYGTFAFSKDGLPTIKTKNPFKQGLIGQRAGLSDSDIKMINLMYNC
ncbi:blastula protease 10-like [Lytechinus variegatus]|uniref:blastula protease 10-like n=1 Tax=Lytechinus variegatus TaxID=7654 RepID=UPI001BB25B46|nr:blastula protease 10-like [Lytechinus variegatus]XP_041485008.1 blastula protease 10-like [Lytechinus variegatus]